MADKINPILKVSKSGFIDFMCDDDGIDMKAIKKELKKKGSFNLLDMVKNCGYIPSKHIKNKKNVSDDLKTVLYDEKGKEFEVAPEDFTIIFV